MAPLAAAAAKEPRSASPPLFGLLLVPERKEGVIWATARRADAADDEAVCFHYVLFIIPPLRGRKRFWPSNRHLPSHGDLFSKAARLFLRVHELDHHCGSPAIRSSGPPCRRDGRVGENDTHFRRKSAVDLLRRISVISISLPPVTAQVRASRAPDLVISELKPTTASAATAESGHGDGRPRRSRSPN